MSNYLNHELKEILREVSKQSETEQKVENKPSNNGSVMAEVPKVADQDPLINSSVSSASNAVLNNMSENATAIASGGLGNDLFLDEKIEITQKEKDAFIESIITGKRYYQPFSIFGGKVNGVLRCRSTEESEALSSWFNANIIENKYATALDYSISVRNALLAAQVEEINGTKFPELKQPLYRTKNGNQVIDPGWLEDANAWSKMPEPLIVGIYDELRKFERKYWTMVMHAGDQNFWKPVEST